MRTILIVGVLLIAGCAYPGRNPLMENSAKWSSTSPNSPQDVVACVRDKFDNEPSGMMVQRAPSTRVERSDDRIQLASITAADVWIWEIVVTPGSEGSHIEAAARYNAGGPYLPTSYMPDKVRSNIEACS